MGILPLKKRVNRDKCSFATKQRMFRVFAIDEILRYRGTRFPGSRTLCHPASQILGAVDALEKRYLRKLKMIIYLDPDQPNVAHEIYTIKVSYHEGLPALDVGGLEQLKTSASALIKGTLQLTEGLDPLPPTAYIGFKLDYVDEDTPEDYEAPGFQKDSETLVVPTGSRRLEIGKMTTSYHSVGLKVQFQMLKRHRQTNW